MIAQHIPQLNTYLSSLSTCTVLVFDNRKVDEIQHFNQKTSMEGELAGLSIFHFLQDDSSKPCLELVELELHTVKCTSV